MRPNYQDQTTNLVQNDVNYQYLPIYTKLWNGFKQFPKNIARGSVNPPETSGTAAAALLSAALSGFCLMVNQHFTSIYPAWNEIIWTLGSWIPGSHNPDPLEGSIGSYSGKETVMLIVWLTSWMILHHLWRDRQIKINTIIFWFISLFLCATVMSWHPLFPYLPLMPSS